LWRFLGILVLLFAKRHTSGWTSLKGVDQIVELIAATTTETGLTVRAELDEKKYPKGLKISDAQLATVNISPHDFHGEWNYTIAQNKKRLKK